MNEAGDWFPLAQDMDKWRDGAGTSGCVKCGNYLISQTLCFLELIKLGRYDRSIVNNKGLGY
jgi:hypothetical protein